MAVYDLDNVNEEYEEDNTLDNMLESCEYMIDMLDESARTKYVEMKGKESEDLNKEYDSIPWEDKENRKRKMEFEEKAAKAGKAASKYSGLTKDDDIIYYYGSHPAKSIHDAGKQKERWGSEDTGAHGYFGNRSKKVDYEAMAKSRAGKEAFNKDFGGPQGRDYIGEKMPAYSREYYGGRRPYTKDSMEDEKNKKIHQDYMKSKIKAHLDDVKRKKEMQAREDRAKEEQERQNKAREEQENKPRETANTAAKSGNGYNFQERLKRFKDLRKKRAEQKNTVKEACLYILSRLDDMDE